MSASILTEWQPSQPIVTQKQQNEAEARLVESVGVFNDFGTFLKVETLKDIIATAQRLIEREENTI